MTPIGETEDQVNPGDPVTGSRWFLGSNKQTHNTLTEGGDSLTETVAQLKHRVQLLENHIKKDVFN